MSSRTAADRMIRNSSPADCLMVMVTVVLVLGAATAPARPTPRWEGDRPRRHITNGTKDGDDGISNNVILIGETASRPTNSVGSAKPVAANDRLMPLQGVPPQLDERVNAPPAPVSTRASSKVDKERERNDDIRRNLLKSRKSRPSREEDRQSVLGKVLIFGLLSLVMGAASFIVYGSPLTLKQVGGWCRKCRSPTPTHQAEKHAVVAAASPHEGDKSPQTAV